MRDKNQNMTPLKEIISELWNGGDLPFNPQDADIWKVWDEVVGPAIAEHARPDWIKDGRLRVAVSDSIWLQELQFLEADIRAKLNQKLKRQAVGKVEFRLQSR